MTEVLEHKRDIFLIFIIGFCLSMMSLYQTYAYDIESEEQTIRQAPDLRYTFNLTDNNPDTYTINLNPGETKLLDLTLTNDNEYNIKYSLYTDKEIEDNTILSVLNTSSHDSTGIISKKSKNVISIVAINKTSKEISYDISYLTGYEKGGELNHDNLIKTTYSFPNTPVLDDNMVPIVYDENLESWVTADISNNNINYYWYEYNLGRWANVAIIDKNILLDISNHEHTALYNNIELKDGIATLKDNTSMIDCGLSNYNFENNLTISLRTKLNTINGETKLFSNNNIELYIDNNSYISLKLNNNNYVSDYKLNTDTYYTITFTYDSKNVKIYVDGNPTNIENSELSGNINISDKPLIIGNNNYQGEISDFIILNKSLKEEDIKSYLSNNISKISILNNNHNDLITYYDFSSNKNILPGTLVKDNDIKSYYVWIPRYKYKVWNIEKESGIVNNNYDPYNQGIDIIFEDKINTTGAISCTYKNITPNNIGTLSETCIGENGEYYTHPAFTFGDKQLTGLWVSKYELTINNNSIISKNNQINNTTSQTITNILNLTAKNTTTKLDSHLIKNLDWGAIAYLSNSIYGLCPNNKCIEIGINNYLSPNNEYQTGCGSNSREISNICNNYNTKEGMKASTTNNVYGVYDMSGAANEYVMATINSTIPNIDTKYYDTYTTTNNNNLYEQESYNRSRLGDAIGEISQNNKLINNGWYNSKLELGTTNNNLLRGGNISITSTQFSLSQGNTNIGYRGVLTEK